MSRSMAVKVLAVVGFSFSFLAGSAVPEGEEPIHPPEFEHFTAVVSSAESLTAEVDLSSHGYARMYRTRLREGAAGGANFAGHYAAVSWGCGNECQGTLIVDLRSGKVLGVKGDAEPLASARGVAFRADSRLLLADPPCPKGSYSNCDCLSDGQGDVPIRYYVIEEDGLRPVGDHRCVESK